MEESLDKSIVIERLNKFLSDAFPLLKADWELSQDGTAVISSPLDPNIAKTVKHQFNEITDLKFGMEILGFGSKLCLVIPVQVLVHELPQDARNKIFEFVTTLKNRK